MHDVTEGRKHFYKLYIPLYLQMCSTVEESAMGLVETATDQAQQQAIQNLGLLQSISADINTILNGKDIAD